MVRHAEDVLEALGLEARSDGGAGNGRTMSSPRCGETRRRASRRSPRNAGPALPELLARLGELELAARVRRLPGPLFVRS